MKKKGNHAVKVICNLLKLGTTALELYYVAANLATGMEISGTEKAASC